MEGFPAKAFAELMGFLKIELRTPVREELTLQTVKIKMGDTGDGRGTK
ncbi:hypothetical protein SOVF_140580 [Spinacia oleracea]|nr:hypothetical protein SOVF_140580 [Spinacia oleracea]